MKNDSRRLSSQIIPLLFSVCIIAIIMYELFYFSFQSNHGDLALISDGLAYLSACDLKSPQDAEVFFQTKKSERREKMLREAEYQKLVEDITNDKMNIWSFFSDYIMLGDSRALDFCHYYYLSYSRVLAENGNTLENIDKHLRAIKSMQPSYIYICYGLNDIVIKPNATADDYAGTLLQKIGLIRKAAPKAKIVVSSILWCTDNVVSRHPSYKKIQYYNNACKEMCISQDILYADNDELCQKYIDTLWSPDGIHPSRGFYQYWAKNLILTSLKYEYKLNNQ